MHTTRPIDAGTQTVSVGYSPSELYPNSFLPLAPASNDADAGMVCKGWTPAPPVVDDEYINLIKPSINRKYFVVGPRVGWVYCYNLIIVMLAIFRDIYELFLAGGHDQAKHCTGH